MNTIFEKLPEDRKRRIIDAAYNEFATHGYKNASTNRLVKELGISKGILFKYFSTKIELYTYLVDTAVASLLQHLAKYELKGDNWREIILSHSSIEFDFLIEKPTIYHFFYKMQQDINDPQLSDIKSDLIQKSNKYLLKLYEYINFNPSKDILLMNHIYYIIKGYNEQFMTTLTDKQANNSDKERYIKGLIKHLELIRG